MLLCWFEFEFILNKEEVLLLLWLRLSALESLTWVDLEKFSLIRSNI